MSIRPLLLAFSAALFITAAGAQSGSGEGDRDDTGGIDFTRDVRPIFSEHCYRCHGRSRRHGQARDDRRRRDAVHGHARRLVLTLVNSTLTSTAAGKRLAAPFAGLVLPGGP